MRRQVPNPFLGQVRVGALAQATVSQAQLLRPYPHFEGVNAVATSWAASTYHSLQAKAEKRFSRGFYLLFSYTYSKLMDYGIGAFGGEVVGGVGFQNNHDLASEWASSALDQTHRAVINWIYEVPVAGGLPKPVRAVLGGWQVSGIYSSLTGGPLGVSAAVNNTFSQGGGQRPNWNGVNPDTGSRNPDRWFDAAPFTNPAPYTFGNAPRTYNGARSDATRQLDLTLSKSLSIFDKLQAQFRAEVFNITNTARFAPPGQVFGNPQFGVVSAQNNQPRIVQFALKLTR